LEPRSSTVRDALRNHAPDFQRVLVLGICS
jgi:hypothetical protein